MTEQPPGPFGHPTATPEFVQGAPSHPAAAADDRPAVEGNPPTEPGYGSVEPGYPAAVSDYFAGGHSHSTGASGYPPAGSGYVPSSPGNPPSAPGHPARPGYPGGQGYPLAVRGPRPVAYPAPVRVESVPGTPYGVAIPRPPTNASGLAGGALAAGTGSILVSTAVWCFGLVGAEDGWGGLVAGAFCVLSALLGCAGLVLGGVGLRQIRRADGALTGRGRAIAAMICGGAGLLLALAGVAVAIALSAGSPTP